MGATPSRLEVLHEARRIAITVGAVREGAYYFEGKDHHDLSVTRVLKGSVPPGRVCGVCIAGATMLAHVMLAGPVEGDPDDLMMEHSEWAETHAVLVANEGLEQREFNEDEAISDVITERGTDYVVAVIDHMILAEEARLLAERPQARTCSVCGKRDPRWHGHDAKGWTHRDGVDVCPPCVFMATGDDARGIGDGLGRAA